MKKSGIFAVVALASGVLWAEMSITVNRVQQRYPWNGLVDIDYTLDVGDPTQYDAGQYFVRFTLTENGKSQVLKAFLDTHHLYNASNGSHRATWNSSAEGSESSFFTKSAKLKAELVFDGGLKRDQPYGGWYTVITLAGSPFPVADEFVPDPSVFTNDVYKTEKLVLRRVTKGEFLMGAPEFELERPWPDNIKKFMGQETQHQVKLTKDFLLGIFEVTEGQWARVMGGGEVNSKRPKANINYNDLRGMYTDPKVYADAAAGSFLQILNAKTQKRFDLPTEAQWEYACRAGTLTCTYIGAYGERLREIAWFSEMGMQAPDFNEPQEVGLLAPNAWGFYDIIGNVWEIARDRVFQTEYTRANYNDWLDNYGRLPGESIPEISVDPISDVRGRVPSPENSTAPLRGGCYDNPAFSSRAACRPVQNRVDLPGGWKSVGFRLSMTIDE